MIILLFQTKYESLDQFLGESNNKELTLFHWLDVHAMYDAFYHLNNASYLVCISHTLQLIFFFSTILLMVSRVITAFVPHHYAFIYHSTDDDYSNKQSEKETEIESDQRELKIPDRGIVTLEPRGLTVLWHHQVIRYSNDQRIRVLDN